MNFASEALAKIVIELAAKSLTPEYVAQLKASGFQKAEAAAAATDTKLDDWAVHLAEEIDANATLMHQLHVLIVAKLWDVADDTSNSFDDIGVKLVAKALGVNADEYRPKVVPPAPPAA